MIYTLAPASPLRCSPRHFLLAPLLGATTRLLLPLSLFSPPHSGNCGLPVLVHLLLCSPRYSAPCAPYRDPPYPPCVSSLLCLPHLKSPPYFASASALSLPLPFLGPLQPIRLSPLACPACPGPPPLSLSLLSFLPLGRVSRFGFPLRPFACHSLLSLFFHFPLLLRLLALTFMPRRSSPCISLFVDASFWPSWDVPLLFHVGLPPSLRALQGGFSRPPSCRIPPPFPLLRPRQPIRLSPSPATTPLFLHSAFSPPPAVAFPSFLFPFSSFSPGLIPLSHLQSLEDFSQGDYIL